MAHVKATAVDQVRVRVLPDGRLSRKDAARYLGRASKTLTLWALEGKGPPAHRVMGRIFYYKSDLDALIRGEPEPVEPEPLKRGTIARQK